MTERPYLLLIFNRHIFFSQLNQGADSESSLPGLDVSSGYYRLYNREPHCLYCFSRPGKAVQYDPWSNLQGGIFADNSGRYPHPAGYATRWNVGDYGLFPFPGPHAVHLYRYESSQTQKNSQAG